MVHVFVTHYARTATQALNDITTDVVTEIERVTDTPHRLTVLGWAEDDATWFDLESKISILPGVRLVRNDRPGRPDTQPSQRNKVLDVAKNEGNEPFVLLHNDVRPTFGWLDRLVADLFECERRWGIGSSIVAPRYIPFHRLSSASPVWENVHAPRFLRADEMANWCAQYGFHFDEIDQRVHCPSWKPPIDDGHQLMMFATRPSFFDAVGLCDEAFTGINYDDSEWGMRALMNGKRNITSQTSLVGHIESLSFGAAGPMAPADNAQVFISKWGRELFNELDSGQMWERLHREQGT